MLIKKNSSSQTSNRVIPVRSGERGAALAAALLMLALLSAIALTVLAVVTTETRIAGSDLKRTQTFYCAAAGIEKMTSDYSALFRESARPTDTQVSSVALAPPNELVTMEGFKFTQSIAVDDATLATMKLTQGITDPLKLPTVTLPADSPYVGLIASVKPYILNTRCYAPDSSSVALTRNMNNYLIPLFQFGMFSDDDIELQPGDPYAFNGRVHANGNIYLAGKVTLLDKLTSAHEVIYGSLRNGNAFATNDVWMSVGPSALKAPLTKGSIQNGPHLSSTCSGTPPVGTNCFPGSPVGTPWVLSTFNWQTESVKPAVSNVANRFGGQLLTRVTGASELKLPMELDGNSTREIIKRRLDTDNAPLPAETSPLSDSRYHSKAGIRILIDDEGVTNDKAGLYAVQNTDEFNSPHDGVNLSTFDPIPLPNSATSGGRALWRLQNSGAYIDLISNSVYQQNAVAGVPVPLQALTVRGSRATTRVNVTPTGSVIPIPRIPAGAGLNGHILIQIVDKDGKWRDVTTEILSMGMTVGEPNAIVHLQRPLWAAFTQGSRDATGGTNSLTEIVNNTGSTYISADGEIKTTSSRPQQDNTYGFLTRIEEDNTLSTDFQGSHPIRADTPPPLCAISDWDSSNWEDKDCWNAIVPINVYNVREGRLSTESTSPTDEANAVYERGITNVVEINMENLARWMDGVYDANLLAGTPALSKNIRNPDGYIVYVSDRRGDNVKSMTVPQFGTATPTTKTFLATNGMADNMDIYYNGAVGKMDAGEDVQATGIAVGTSFTTSTKDTAELPDPVDAFGNPTSPDERSKRALRVAAWTNPNNYFRRSVRLFNAEDLQVTAATDKLSTTLGITIASENMVYTWGNYNTTGINKNTASGNVNNGPAVGTTSLNDSTKDSYYTPTGSGDRQVPASIVSDAWFPLSKNWFDSASSMYPDDLDKRLADFVTSGSLPSTAETSVRAGIIAGNNLGALAQQPDAGNFLKGESRINGGIHNFPRFLEKWGGRFNFVGSLIPLYRSTQAVAPFNYHSTVYSPPDRNWAFDITFTSPAKLPPGTPMFQHVEPTGFKQLL